MDYYYLSRWLDEVNFEGLTCKKVEHSADQYRITFYKTKQYLLINLSVAQSYCFFTNSLPIDFKPINSKMGKLLQGAKVKRAFIQKDDRIVTMELNRVDIFGNNQNFQLILELIPRYSNMILIQDGFIVDSVRFFNYSQNKKRQIIVGKAYQKPKTAFVHRKEVPKDFLCFEGKKYADVNSYLAEFYLQQVINKPQKAQRLKREKRLLKTIQKSKRKLSLLKTLQKNNQETQQLKQKGQILQVNIDKLKKGISSITLPNLFDEKLSQIEIELKENLSPKENIARYFKGYKKAKSGAEKVQLQINKLENRIGELTEKLDEEFEDKPKNFQPVKKSEGRRFKLLKIADEWEVLVGRNATESDFLTLKVAKQNDWWFHARAIHGSHVIARNLKRRELDIQVKQICCRLAAYYSKARFSKGVAVDFTQVRYVRKPRKSKAGYVEYKNQKTLFVEPVSIRDAKNEIFTKG